MGWLKRLWARAARRRTTGLGVITVAEIILLLVAFVPLMEAGAAIDTNQPATLSYMWWSVTASKPGVFIMVSLIGGALGGALHSIASLSRHVAKRDFGREWTMWYLVNPFVGAALATVFLFVLQAGLGGQTAPTTGGLYGIAAVATLTGLFSRHALAKLRDIFDVAFASNGRRDPQERPDASHTNTTGNGSRPVTPSIPVGPPASTPLSNSPGQAAQLASDGATPGGTGVMAMSGSAPTLEGYTSPSSRGTSWTSSAY
jgi:hypothetical protein